MRHLFFIEDGPTGFSWDGNRTFCGATTLPFDLLILWPLPSTTNPCVSNALKGARPLMAQPVSRLDWNQPRCWSEPSRYKSAGECNAVRRCNTDACVTPESNHTSSVS